MKYKPPKSTASENACTLRPDCRCSAVVMLAVRRKRHERSRSRAASFATDHRKPVLISFLLRNVCTTTTSALRRAAPPRYDHKRPHYVVRLNVAEDQRMAGRTRMNDGLAVTCFICTLRSSFTDGVRTLKCVNNASFGMNTRIIAGTTIKDSHILQLR